MNILIKLTCLIGLVIAPILGEGNDTSNTEFKTVPLIVYDISNPQILSKTETFIFNKENKSIESFVLIDVRCKDNVMICDEIMKFTKKQPMVFNANAKVLVDTNKSEFKQQVKGVFTIGSEKFDASFSFNVHKNNNQASFNGILIFENNETFKSVNKKVSISVKGRKKQVAL